MSGALTQLIALGAENQYVTGGGGGGDSSRSNNTRIYPLPRGTHSTHYNPPLNDPNNNDNGQDYQLVYKCQNSKCHKTYKILAMESNDLSNIFASYDECFKHCK